MAVTCLLFTFVVTACGAAVSATTTTGIGTTMSTSTVSETTTQPLESTTTSSPTTTSRPEADVEIADGVVGGPEVFEYELMETVDIRVVSDVDDELHIHGYDLVFALAAGVPTQITFVADLPGVFEVEVHTGHAVVFEIEVVG